MQNKVSFIDPLQPHPLDPDPVFLLSATISTSTSTTVTLTNSFKLQKLLPSSKEKEDFLGHWQLAGTNAKPAVLAVAPGYCDVYIPESFI